MTRDDRQRADIPPEQAELEQLQKEADARRQLRDERQRAVLKWAGDTFGLDAIAPVERVRRLLEEVIELAQAEGLTLRDIVAVADHVLKKPPGNPAQEVGGIGVCLLAYCASRGISADGEEVRELERVLAIDPDYFRRRHNAKADAGIAVRAPEPESKG